MKKRWMLLLCLLTGAICAACGAGGADKATYHHVSPEEAMELMGQEGCLIVDVRRQDEYDAGHIPGAVCVPNEEIQLEHIAELPDKGQLLLVYCRSGRRSREAAGKLAELGYTNIYEFGGILDWPGDVVTD